MKISKPQPTNTLWDLFLNILPFLVIIILVIIIIAGAIYRKKSKFTAEEVFLIHHGGTLITHLSRQQQANVDDVIFSGMFTAVQDFIHDTFVSDNGQEQSQEDQWALDELKLGDNNILIERSRYTYLAVIFSGEGSKRLRRIVIRLLDKIENKYSNILPKWEGNINELKGTKEILSVLIPLKEESEQSQVQVGTSPTSLEPLLKPNPIPQSKPVTGRPLPIAQPVKPPLKPIPSKELLGHIGEQTGVKQPGLTAWPLKKKLATQKLIFDKHAMPVALRISLHRSLPETVVMRKGFITINGKSQPRSYPKDLTVSNKSHPVSVQMPGSGKEFKIDPSRSLLQQLAEMEDED